MDQLVTTVIPVFGLVGFGYLVAWSGLLGAESGDVLASFVFVIPIPLLIFRVLAVTDFSGGTPWQLWLAYYFPFAIAWIAGTTIMRRVFHRDARAGVVAGVSAAYSNALLLGIPLVLAAYGSEGAAAVTLLVATHLPVLMVLSAVLIERALIADGLAPDADTATLARSLARGLATNPIIIGLVAGLAWRFTGWPLAGPAGAVVNRLADTGATLALFSVGMGLRKYGISRNIPQALITAVIKLAVLPGLVALVLIWFVPLPPVWAKALVIAAACPTGVNAYIVANRFGTGEALASNSITLTTGLAVVTITLWLHLVDLLF
jgi:predicted permease